MGTLWQDIRYGFRMLARSPGVTFVVVLILTPGIGADAGASAMAHAVLMSSLPLADSNQTPLDNGPTSKLGRSASEDRKLGKLVAWWKLDEVDGSVVVDSSGHGFAGTLIGHPRWQPTAGKVKGALAFDGVGDSVEIKNEPAFSITGAITVAAWIKVNSFDKRWQTIVAKGDTAWRLQRTAEKDTLAFHCTGLNSVNGQWPHGIEGKKSVNDDKWHHVAGVYDGAVISLYIDGVLDNSSRASGTIQTNGLPVSIGANAEASVRNWSGLIDDICVFACALNASGISALYSGGDPATIAEQASALVSAEDIKAELRAGQVNDANAPEPDKKKSRRWTLTVMILLGVALTAGVYVVQRRRSDS